MKTSLILMLTIAMMVSACTTPGPISTRPAPSSSVPETRMPKVEPIVTAKSTATNIIATGVPIVARVQDAEIWTEEDVKSYFQNTWDWTTNDRKQFTTYWGEPLAPPWETDASVGVPVSGKNKPLPTQGWRLYEKHLNCTDYGQSEGCKPSEGGKTNLFPHFSLYNIYMGVLRTFIFLNREQEDDARVLVGTDVVQGASNSNIVDYGLFLNSGDLAGTFSTKTINRNRGYATVVPAYLGRWVVVDRQISYDPSEIPRDLRFFFYTNGHRQEQIHLTGQLVESAPNAIDKEWRLNDPSAYFDFVIGAGGTVAKRLGDVQQLADSLQSKADWLQANGWTKLGDATESTAKAAAQGGPYVALVVAALEIVNSVSKYFGSLETQYTPKAMTVDIDGEVLGERTLDMFRIGVHGSAQEIENELTPVLQNNFSGKLGLFSLARPPLFEVGDDYLTLLDDIRSLVLVNPDANMQLVDLKVQPIISVPKTQAYCKGWPVTNQLYADIVAVPGLVETEAAGLRVRMTKDMIEPSEVNFSWDPRSGCHNSDPDHGDVMADNSTVQRILLKIYLRFQHTDPNHSDIFAEFVRTYESVILSTECSRGSSKDQDEAYWEIGSFTGYVLTSDIVQYTYRPCSMPEGGVVLFKHSYYRGLDTDWGPNVHVGRYYFAVNPSETEGGIAYLSSTPVENDELSSLMIAPFTEVTLYKDVNFKGPSITFRFGDRVTNLKDYDGWNDEVSSIRVRKNRAWIVPLLFGQ